MTRPATVLALSAGLILVAAPVLSGYVCKPCPLNFYCKRDKIYACPSDKPVTFGLGAKSEADCITCVLRDESTATPVFDGTDCVSCYESSYQSENPTHIWQDNTCVSCAVATKGVSPVYSDLDGGCITCEQSNPDTPYWDGIACVSCDGGSYKEEIVCPANTRYNSTTASCEYIIVTIPTAIGGFDLSADMVVVLNEKITYAECLAMLDDPKYPEITECYYWGDWWGLTDSSYGPEYAYDYWAGAVKYCRDQGKRMPTFDELIYVARELYGNQSISTDLVSESYTVTVQNTDLLNILHSQGTDYYYTTFVTGQIYGSYSSSRANFNETSFVKVPGARNNYPNVLTFCLPQ